MPERSGGFLARIRDRFSDLGKPDEPAQAPVDVVPPPQDPLLVPPPADAPRRHHLDNDHVRVLLRVLIVATVVIALIVVETSSRSGVLWRLITFTYQANVLAAAYYSWTCSPPAGMAAAASAVRSSSMSWWPGFSGTCC